MNLRMTRLPLLALLICATGLVGCPLLVPTPELSVSPLAVNFGPSGVHESLTIANTGNGTLRWTLEEVVWNDQGSGTGTWVATDIPWLTATTSSGAITSGVKQVELLADRADMASGLYNGTGVRIASNGGTSVVRVAMTVEATMVVNPMSIGLPLDATSTSFGIQNRGTTTQNWHVDFLTDADDLSTTAALPAWLTVTPQEGSLRSGEQVNVALAWPAWTDTPQDFALLVTSHTDRAVVTVSFGTSDLVVTPSPLVFYGLGDAATVTITNNGTAAVGWQLVLRNLVDAEGKVPVALDTTAGVTSAGQASTVQATVNETDPDHVLFGEGSYALVVNTEKVQFVIPILIEASNLPVITVSDPPNPNVQDPPPVPISTLDFGDESYQQVFYIANTGPVGSTLYFRITHEDEGEANPLLDSITPAEGSTEGDDPVFYMADRGDFIHGVPVTVTINRNNLTDPVEYRVITVTAWDSEFQRPLDALDPVTLNIRVERPPIRFEGAQHRSRPPFMLRFVFRLRDTLGKAIDTRDPEIFAALQNAFTVYEDGTRLTGETNHFVTYAEDLRYDLVLLLDYTGSMFETVGNDPLFTDSADPLADLYAGKSDTPDDEGIVGQFLRDLPDSYQLALMEYHDRQQGDRLIHPFSTSDDSLIAGLKAFTLTPGAHGVSEIYDALIEACTRLAEKDAGAEPFITDADVRAVVFISDGRDTSSSAALSEVISVAQENKVQLYPIAFGGEADNAPLIAMASETGGHFYQAKYVSGLEGQTLETVLVRDPEDPRLNAPGTLITDLERQIVLTYVSPIPAGAGSHTYTLTVDYSGDEGSVENTVLSGENLMAEGDVRAGQISLVTSGIVGHRADVFVRAEYVPRDVHGFRFRIVTTPETVLTADDVALAGLLGDADGKAGTWRLIDEGNNVFRITTNTAGALAYGSFGNLLRVTFDGIDDGFQVGIRIDNSLYGPPTNAFFQCPTEHLVLSASPDIVAVPLDNVILIEDGFDPSAPDAFDSDDDGTRDFDDPWLLDPAAPPLLVSPVDVDFGSVDTTAVVRLTNERFDDLVWQVDGSIAGLAFSVGTTAAQALAVGGQQDLTLTLDRSSYAPGSYVRAFTIVTTNAAGLSTERFDVKVSFTVASALTAAPTRLDFAAWVDAADLTLGNAGADAVDWTLTVVDPDHPAATEPPEFMIFDPPVLAGSIAAGGANVVSLTINRAHPDLAEYGTYAYELIARATTVAGVGRGTVRIPVEIVVAGHPELHVLHEDAEVNPAEGLWMLMGQESLDIVLRNEGDEAMTWGLSLTYLDNPSIAAAGLPMAFSPSEGALASGRETTVHLVVDQRALIQVLGEGNHAFRLSVAWDLGVFDIPLTINLEPLPTIATVKEPEAGLSNPPVEFIDTLDFGTDEYQMVFYLANIGHQDSKLYFDIENEDGVSVTPLVADVTPLQGCPEDDPSAAHFEYASRVVAASPIVVTIDRNNIDGEVAFRTLTIVARDKSFRRELTAVDRLDLKIRVERPPLRFEGAQNRSRPPFMLRFNFLLRDRFGNAIDTLDPGIFAELQNAFSVYEDKVLLPSTETNHFVTYAKDLRYDLVVLLDYTGSMYAAAQAEFPGVAHPLQRLYAGDPANPADEGAVGAFVRDLPDSYRIALMEYHDRQQADRLVHGFDTKDDAIIASLQGFSLPQAFHGASQVYDALVDAVARLVEKDQGALPLVEDADVRAIVFISDGWDTSSSASLSDVITVAKAARVRLYPIGFGSDVNLVSLISLATETGGHFYRAPKVQDYATQDLLDLLAHDSKSDDDAAPGIVATELARQIVLTYITLLPGPHQYQVRATFRGDTGSIEDTAALSNDTLDGDVRAGQVSMSTTGISDESAEVYVRADYVPRNISRFRFRLVPSNHTAISPDAIEMVGLLEDDGMPPDDWRIIAEGNNIFTIVADEGSFLPYGSFGQLLRITFRNVTASFELGLRVDNSLYLDPPNTTFFQSPLENLVIASGASDVVAVPIEDIYLVSDGFDPHATGAFDADSDGTGDFDDPEPLNADYPAPFAAPTLFDFGSDRIAATLNLTNQRFEDVTWTLADDVPWLTVSVVSGALPVGTETPVVLTVDRTGLFPGRHADTLSLELSSLAGMSVQRVELRVSLTVPPGLNVAPTDLAFPAAVADSAFTVANVGTVPFDWTVEPVNPDYPDEVIPWPTALSATTAASGTLAVAGEAVVGLHVDRSSLDLGQYTYMVRVTTSPDMGEQLVSINVVVAGTPNLVATERGVELEQNDSIWIRTGQEALDLNLLNDGDDRLTWALELVHDPEAGVSVPVDTMPITVVPSEGAIESDDDTTVTISVNQATLLEQLGEGSHRFRLTIEWDRDTLNLWLFIDLKAMPVISVNKSTLDYGNDPESLEAVFELANVGELYSELHYAFEVIDEPNPQTPLIINVQNQRESATGTLRVENPLAYPVEEIRVNIDRSQVLAQVERRTLRVYDTEIPAVEPVDIVIRVEQSPLTIEGAINRSRPPFIMRFVFLVRDRVGQVITTRTAEDRACLEFAVEEDGLLLDPGETSQFVTGPENLKCNVVLLLDYTGSMYNAGVGDLEHPLEPGEAIDLMVEAAKGFVDDLPPTYRLAIMEYHDKQQSDRLIHGFTNDKEALKLALDTFALAPPDHGASAIHDALVNACEILEAEDPAETIPFDDADVRAVVFISDGWDTSSVNELKDTVDYAQDARVRLYPVGFSGGETVNNASLVTLATETGGHVYYAPEVRSLDEILANEKGLALDGTTGPLAGLGGTFDICNTSLSAFSWTIAPPAAGWLTVDEPYAGASVAGACRTVSFVADDSGLTPGTYTDVILVHAQQEGTGDETPEVLEAAATAQLRVKSGDPSALSIRLTDVDGRIWRELKNQVVLTYVSLIQEGTHSYNIHATYTDENNNQFEGDFERDGVYWLGDAIQGQISLWTTTRFANGPNALGNYTAEAYVRTDYVPRNISMFRFRFFTTFTPPEDMPEAVTADILAHLPSIRDAHVELAPDGLLRNWRLISEGDGVYTALTEQSNPLQFGAFGNLLRITFSDLNDYVAAFDAVADLPYFEIGFRLDNTLYYSPAVPPSTPSLTKYFVYPGGYLNPGRTLIVGTGSDVATPAKEPLDLTLTGFDPEAPYAWDSDEDGITDFDDPDPFDGSVPAPFVIPQVVTFAGSETTSSFTVRNNRLDTFGWLVTGMPSWVAAPVIGTTGTLAPGASTTVAVTVSRAGLAAGVYYGSIALETDFGARHIEVSMVVP